MRSIVLAALLGAVVMFLWGWLSWAVLPWQMAVSNRFADEAAMQQALKMNGPKTGVYYLPFESADERPGEPAAFVNLRPDGWGMSIARTMIVGLIGLFVAALLVLWLLGRARIPTYGGRVGFIALAGLAIAFYGNFVYWNWYGFPTSYTIVQMLDALIGWALAGLVMARFAGSRNKAP